MFVADTARFRRSLSGCANQFTVFKTGPDRGVDTQAQRTDGLLRWAAIVGCGAFLCQLIAYNFVDIDIWHQMALIRDSLSAGHLLKSDPYAYTPTVGAWIDHEWGAGAIAYFTTAWFGSRAVLVLKFLTALGTGFLCVRCAAMRGVDFRLLGLCAPLPIFLSYLGFFATIRAQAYTFLLTVLLLLLLEFDRQGTRSWMIAWLAVFPLWVNLHAGFVVALGLIGLHASEQLLRRKPARHLLLLLAGMVLEIFLNPYGVEYFSYLKRGLMMARPYAPEWGPFWGLGSVWTVAFVVAVLAAVYSVWTLGWRQAPGILVLAATAVEAALHRKHLPLLAIAWFCYVPGFLQETNAGKWGTGFARRRSQFLIAAWITFAGVCIVTGIRQKPWDLVVPQPLYPVGPVEYLATQKFAGNLMVPFRLGAYVSWKLYPKVKVSLDSRYEVAYPDTVVAQVFDFYDAHPDWRATLEAFPTDAVLVPGDTPIAGLMPSTGWACVYTDRQFQIYARPGLPLPVQDWSSRSFAGSFP
jgi:hypothetical protein